MFKDRIASPAITFALQTLPLGEIYTGEIVGDETPVEPCRPDDAPPYPKVSPWVRRSEDNDLPTFSTHSSAYAYRDR